MQYFSKKGTINAFEKEILQSIGESIMSFITQKKKDDKFKEHIPTNAENSMRSMESDSSQSGPEQAEKTDIRKSKSDKVKK